MINASPHSSAVSSANGESSPHELFALSDEQILEIEAEPVVLSERKALSASEQGAASKRDSSVAALAQNDSAQHLAPTSHQSPVTSHQSPSTSHESPVTNHDTAEPPPWLAAQMKDPWSGEEAREFWNGVQQAKTEAAAYQVYRAAIASPEDARALKELYPGGVAEARAAADRARLLEEIDRAYFGAATATPAQLGASRAQLAQRMLREDPAAFREMVIAGLRVLEEAGKGSDSPASPDLPRLAKVFTQGSEDVNVAPPFTAAPSSEASTTNNSPVAALHAAPLRRNATGPETPGPQALHQSPVTTHESLSAYAAFERAANEDLERTVGSAIERTLEQALPGISKRADAATAGARHAVPVQQRLATAIRQDVEHALQGDRQLGEQVLQVLASRRFDNDTRAQVVRLINERAQQLVPSAAKRVLNDWTQTTLAAHRSRTQREDSAAHRVDLAPADAAPVHAEPRSASSPARVTPRNTDTRRLEASATNTPRRVDYRKLSDEQILDLS